MTRPQVLLYELNEVSWLVIDRFLAKNPTSPLAEILGRSACFTTVVDDPNPLEPWRTWPILHTGLSSQEHKSLDLGQDPTSFEGEPLWHSAAAQGRSVGVFGALQSWPAQQLPRGAFFVPDTFARTADCIPKSLTPVQALNLRLTQDNTFSADAPIPKRALLTAPYQFFRAGVRPTSALRLGGQIVREAFNARAKAGRSIMQAVPMFDIFMKQLARHNPDLSIFFTNHVAGMMHRFWADGMAEFGDSSPYDPDPLHQTLVWKAMELFAEQLQRVSRWAAAADNRVVIVASSMGQAEIPYDDVKDCFVVTHPELLLQFAGAPAARPGLAMYPAYSFEFDSGQQAETAAQALELLTTQAGALFEHTRTAGNTVHVDVVSTGSHPDPAQAILTNASGTSSSLLRAGMSIRRRLGGANTAHHIPEGSLFMFGSGVTPNSTRENVDLRSVKDMVLEQLGCSVSVRSS